MNYSWKVHKLLTGVSLHNLFLEDMKVELAEYNHHFYGIETIKGNGAFDCYELIIEILQHFQCSSIIKGYTREQLMRMLW